MTAATKKKTIFISYISISLRFNFIPHSQFCSVPSFCCARKHFSNERMKFAFSFNFNRIWMELPTILFLLTHFPFQRLAHASHHITCPLVRRRRSSVRTIGVYLILYTAVDTHALHLNNTQTRISPTSSVRFGSVQFNST